MDVKSMVSLLVVNRLERDLKNTTESGSLVLVPSARLPSYSVVVNPVGKDAVPSPDPNETIKRSGVRRDPVAGSIGKALGSTLKFIRRIRLGVSVSAAALAGTQSRNT